MSAVAQALLGGAAFRPGKVGDRKGPGDGLPHRVDRDVDVLAGVAGPGAVMGLCAHGAEQETNDQADRPAEQSGAEKRLAARFQFLKHSPPS